MEPIDGTILEIEEFGVHDGPGIRTVVFLKGCPLGCSWCQNPEAIDFGTQNEGFVMSDAELATRLLRHKKMLNDSGGGVTFSGGEPLSQAKFVIAVTTAVHPMNVAIETSGQAASAIFAAVVSSVDLVMIDVKHTDPGIHKQFTGHDNRQILANLGYLCAGTKPFIVRVPLIPGVNDGEDNLNRTADLIAGATALAGVELLPYNTMAPAKYPRAGRVFQPGFDTLATPRIDTKIFTKRGIKCDVL